MDRTHRKIPQALVAAVVARAREVDPATGRPPTQRELAAWLTTVHNVKASRMAVCRALAAADEKGDALIVTALREELRDAVLPAKRTLMRAVRQLDDALQNEKKTEALASGVRALSTALNTLGRLGGVAAPLSVDVTSGGQPLPDAHAALTAAVARLAQEPGADAADEADPEPPG